MNMVKRYECTSVYGDPVMEKDSQFGDWVKFEDYLEMLASLAPACPDGEHKFVYVLGGADACIKCGRLQSGKKDD